MNVKLCLDKGEKVKGRKNVVVGVLDGEGGKVGEWEVGVK